MEVKTHQVQEVNFDKIIASIPPVCPGHLPPRVAQALNFKSAGLEGSAFETAMTDYDQKRGGPANG